MKQAAHLSVLLTEAVDALITDLNGVYFDGTFGRGGHSREILGRLDVKGRLLAMDRDPDAASCAHSLAVADPRFSFVDGASADISSVCAQFNLVSGLNGVLLDLGVSSPQLDEAQRGFSFMHSGPLDMRMDPRQGQSVAQWLDTASEAQIATVLWELGEERFSKRIASAIVANRPLETTEQLAQLICDTVPRREKEKHPATRTFLALRILINDELGQLETTLRQGLDLLRAGGRLVVISFHSLEDRMVKRFMRDQARGYSATHAPDWAGEQAQPMVKLVGKAIRASEQEVQRNVRARSAVMRIAEKLS